MTIHFMPGPNSESRSIVTKQSRKTRMAALTLLTIVAVGACGKKRLVVPPSAPPNGTAAQTAKSEPESEGMDKPVPASGSIEEADLPAAASLTTMTETADRLFSEGNYAAAAPLYQRLAPKDDLSLFRHCVLLALNGEAESSQEYEKNLEKLLSSSDPEYVAVAQLLIDLQREVRAGKEDRKRTAERLKRVEEQLEKLKQIDLNRRPPQGR